MRGLRIGIMYELKDKLSGGLNRIKERMSSVNDLQKKARVKSKEYFDSFSKSAKEALPSLDNFKLKNVELFDALQDQMPFLGRLGGLLSNPYILAVAGAVALGAATVKLGQEMFRVSQEVEKNQRIVGAAFDITGTQLDKATTRVMAIGRIMNAEVKDLAEAANTMHREYKDTGVGVADSLQNIKLGLLATNGQLDLQEIKEYSSQMRNAGVSASELVAISVKGKKEGIFSDKALDAVKEFNLRIREMTPNAAKALQGIGLESASIMKDLDNGSKGVLDILREVSGAMAGANTQARQTAIADLFGGAGEDAGQRFLLSLSGANFNLREMVDLHNPLIARQAKRLALEEKIVGAQTDTADIFNDMRHNVEDLTHELKFGLFDTMSKLLTPTKAVLRAFEDQRLKLKALESSASPLIREYESISGKVGKSADEHVRLNTLAEKLLEIMPRAAAGFDQFGQATGFSIEKAKELLSVEKELFKMRNKDLLKANNKEIERLAMKTRILQTDLNNGFVMESSSAGIGGVSQTKKRFNDNDLLERRAMLEEANKELINKLLLQKEYGTLTKEQSDKLFNLQGRGQMVGPVANNDPFNLGLPVPKKKEAGGSGNDPGSGSAGSSVAEHLATNSAQVRNVTVHIQNLNEGGINVHTKTVQESAVDMKDLFTEMLIEAIRNAEEVI